MGGSSWSDEHYSARALHRSATNTPVFAYDRSIKSGAAPAKAHDSLDPSKLKAGVRECRDSDKHPESVPVFVGFDVTGSMHTVPQVLQKNLCSLMGLLLRKSYLADASICVAGIGDATCDQAPLQIGQFESGIEIENDLTNLFLEGGGGGQRTESYELALYFLARKTACDAWDKRQKKGYAFLIGDEMAYSRVDRLQVERIFGDKLEAHIPLAQIVAEAQAKWEVFYILPKMTAYYHEAAIIDFWKDLLGQQALKLEDPAAISDFIAAQIGVCEGAVDVSGLTKDLTDAGVGAVDTVTKAVVVRDGGGAVAAVTKGTGLATL